MSGPSTELVVDLLRHGDVEGGDRVRGRNNDDHLSALGLQQMRAQTAAPRQWDAIVSSPLQRCVGYAYELSLTRDLDLRVDDDLAEFDFGDWSNQSTAEIWQQFPTQARDFFTDPSSVQPPGGETYAMFQERVMAAWQRLCADPKNERMLVVTHSITIRALVASLLQLPPSRLFALDVPSACMTRLRVFRDQGVSLHTVLAAHWPLAD